MPSPILGSSNAVLGQTVSSVSPNTGASGSSFTVTVTFAVSSWFASQELVDVAVIVYVVVVFGSTS